MNVRGVDLPIALRYDASGVRVNTLPGWLGHNWSLEAGGVITRIKNGEYDEWLYRNYEYYNYYQSFEAWDSCIEAIESGDYESFGVRHTRHDFAPDVFMFNFMGHTGKFFLDHNGVWRVMSEENMEIIMAYNNAANFCVPLVGHYPNSSETPSKSIYGFRLRDEHGNIYTFGYRPNAIEYTTTFFCMTAREGTEAWHAQSWYLTSVHDRYNNLLYDFDYDRGYYIINGYNACSYTGYDYGTNMFSGFHTGSDTETRTGDFPFDFSIVSPVYLNEIRSAAGDTLSLSSSDVDIDSYDLYKGLYDYYRPGLSREAQINDVDILLRNKAFASAGSGVPSPNYNRFYYLESSLPELMSYCYMPNPENPNYHILGHSRLRKLDTIVLPTSETIRFVYNYNSRMHLTKVMNGGKLYQLRYNQFNKLPSDYLTTACDHWGYYRGNPYNRNTFVDDVWNYSETLNPNADSILVGTLNEIKYPTGGRTVFSYEVNRFRAVQDNGELEPNQGGSSCYGAGVRVSSIAEYDDDSNDHLLSSRIFTYNIPSTNIDSGELYAKPRYVWLNWHANAPYLNYNYSMLRSTSIIPLSNMFGAILGYSYVTETRGDGSRILYQYSNFSSPNACDERYVYDINNHIESPFDTHTDKGFMRGRLISKTIYDNQQQVAEVTKYEYRNDTENYTSQYELLPDITYFNSHVVLESTYIGTAIFAGGAKKMYYCKYDLSNAIDTIFVGGEQQTLTTSFGREDLNVTTQYNNVVNVRRLVSKGEYTARGNVHSVMYTYDNSLAYNSFYLQPICETDVRNGTYLAMTHTNYRMANINGSNCSVPANVVRETNQGLDTLVVFDDYTSTGVLSKYTESGHPSVYLLWGNNDNNVVMKSYEDIRDRGFSTEYVLPFDYLLPTAQYQSGELEQKTQQMQSDIQSVGKPTWGYIYRKGVGLVSEIQPNGYTLKYTYDKERRLNGIYDERGVLKRYEYYYRNGLPLIHI